jgi:phage I-like protein
MNQVVLLPIIELKADLSPSPGPVWVQLARIGRFFSTRYKQFDITEKTLEEMELNFDTTQQAPFDLDHLSTTPVDKRPTADAGRAVGWIQKLERRDGGKTLWGLTEWGEEAIELIRKKAYKYVSPTFHPNYTTTEDEPKAIGAKLIAAALTNHPFLHRMEAVACNADLVALVDISLDEKTRRISQSFYDRFNTSWESGAYIVEMFEKYVIARKDGKSWKIPIKADKELTEIEWGEPVEVVSTWKTLGSDGENNMAGTTTETKPNQSADNSQVLQLSEMQQTIIQMRADLDAEKAKNEEISKTLKKTLATSRVEGLIAEGKLLPVQKDWAITYAMSNSEQFEQFAGTLQVVVKLNKEEGSGEGDAAAVNTGGNPLEATRKAFEDRVDAVAKERNISLVDAMHIVQEEQPQLALSYLEATRELTAVS